MCADGGANQLYDALGGRSSANNNEDSLMVPDFVVGDLDSIRPEVE